jgi:hypothetical protein
VARSVAISVAVVVVRAMARAVARVVVRVWAMAVEVAVGVGVGCRGVSGGVLVGGWHSYSVGTGTLMSKEEGPNNLHEVEGIEGMWRGEHYKG